MHPLLKKSWIRPCILNLFKNFYTDGQNKFSGKRDYFTVFSSSPVHNRFNRWSTKKVNRWGLWEGGWSAPVAPHLPMGLQGTHESCQYKLVQLISNEEEGVCPRELKASYNCKCLPSHQSDSECSVAIQTYKDQT